MTAKRGRPAKISTAEKKKVIDNFYAFVAGYSPDKMTEHNIYAQIARYADSCKWFPEGTKLTAKNLSTDTEVRAYIEQLSGQQKIKASDLTVGVYVPIEFEVIECKPVGEILRLFREREAYYEDICVQSGSISRYCKSLNAENRRLKKELLSVRAELRVAYQSVGEQEDLLVACTAELRQLKRTARSANKSATQEYFDSIPQRGLPNNVISLMSSQPVGVPNTVDDNDDDFEIKEWTYGP